METIKKILSNVYVISIVKKLNVIVFGVLTTALLSRYLGPENMGQYSYLLSVANILITVFNLGINQAYPNFRRKDESLYLSIFLSLSLFLFLALSAITLISFLFLNDIYLSMILLLSTIGVLRIQLIQYTLVEKIMWHSISAIISSFSNFLMLVFVVMFYESNIIIALIVYLIKDLTVIIISLYSLRDSLLNLKFTLFSHWGQIIKYGIIPTYTTLLVTLNYQIDVIILKDIGIDLRLIGLYSAGVSLAQYGWLIPDIFKDVMINKTAKSDDIKNMSFSLRLSSTLMIFVYVALFICGELIMKILFGNEFIEGYPISILIFLGIYSMIYTKIIGTLYIAQGKLRFYASVLTLSVVLNIIGNYLLIPIFNIYGAGMTTVASYTLAGLIFLYDFKRTYSLRFKDIMIVSKEDIRLIYKTFF
ncbi:oligosaccharide flippase family protein [Aerococcus urinaeequi]|uniref:oligosaccharide flippase family protein n=1 Tax=Aerococcus urinaeequi TaxID=51665 RepID=UPI003B3A282B